jgi:predicted nucleic acid-binding protein
MRVALDTNILVYLVGVSAGPNDDDKIPQVRKAIRDLAASASLVVPLQTLGELFVVLRRSGLSAAESREAVLEFSHSLATAQASDQTVLAALDLVVDHKLQYWDALIVSTAAEAGCGILLSEDMHHGFVVRGMTVINPLRSKPHPKLAKLLAG